MTLDCISMWKKIRKQWIENFVNVRYKSTHKYLFCLPYKQSNRILFDRHVCIYGPSPSFISFDRRIKLPARHDLRTDHTQNKLSKKNCTSFAPFSVVFTLLGGVENTYHHYSRYDRIKQVIIGKLVLPNIEPNSRKSNNE